MSSTSITQDKQDLPGGSKSLDFAITSHILSKYFPSAEQNLHRLEDILGYTFCNKNLLLEAITHKSAIDFVQKNIDKKNNEIKKSLNWNERLEFLGDAVLQLTISDVLWKSYPTSPEGVLSKTRSFLVNKVTLAKIGRSLSLESLILAYSGDTSSDQISLINDRLIADSLEAIFGAIYLDAGFLKSAEVIETLFKEELDAKPSLRKFDYKTQLQEECQKQFGCPPDYNVLEESGPDHQKEFTLAVELNGSLLGTGHGKSKKSASQKAAKIALEHLANLKLNENLKSNAAHAARGANITASSREQERSL